VARDSQALRDSASSAKAWLDMSRMTATAKATLNPNLMVFKVPPFYVDEACSHEITK
jgi:hypothetical protein